MIQTPVAPSLAPEPAQEQPQELTPLAGRLYGALQKLAAEVIPHPNGGYDVEDIRRMMRRDGPVDDGMADALYDLDRAGLLRYCGGVFSKGDFLSCFAAKKGGAR